MISHVDSNMCNCINLNNHQSHIKTRIDFSMRLKSIFNITPAQQSLGFVLAAFVFKDFPLSSVFAGKGFSEVADWLRVQESLKWALAGFAESWACRLWQT